MYVYIYIYYYMLHYIISVLYGPGPLLIVLYVALTSITLETLAIEKRPYIFENCKCCSSWSLDDLVSSYARDSTVYNA